MNFPNWTNKYVHLVRTLPDILINGEEKVPTAEEILRVKEIVRRFPKLYVELGSGSGGHIIERAGQDPDALYAGFELRYKRAFRTAEKSQKQGLHNLLIIRTDASSLRSFFEPESVDGFFMNFPDPWDRKKWKKHRMINEESLKNFHALLKSGASFRYKTDHEGYFDDTLTLVEKSDLFTVARLTRDLHLSEHTNDNVTTEFERLFISQGLPTYFVELLKK